MRAGFKTSVGLIVVARLAGTAVPCRAAELPAVLDPLPADYRARLELFERTLEFERRAAVELFERLPREVLPDFVFVPREYRWPDNATVKVAFLGGTDLLRARVEAVARDWVDAQDLTLALSFRDRPGDFHEWSRADVDYAAHVRIAFDLDGYWSLVGNASRVSAVVGPHQASMSLGGFEDDLPGDWDVVILHEFGHALGLEHEHQHPGEDCSAQMKWRPDPGYVETSDPYGSSIADGEGRSPGLLLYFGGPPNNWSEPETRRNVEAIDEDVVTGAFDRESIMKYYFPAWLFTEGRASPCFREPSFVLSKGDRQGMACFYSSTPPADCPAEPAVTDVQPAASMEELRRAVPELLFETLRDTGRAMRAMVSPPPREP